MSLKKHCTKLILAPRTPVPEHEAERITVLLDALHNLPTEALITIDQLIDRDALVRYALDSDAVADCILAVRQGCVRAEA